MKIISIFLIVFTLFSCFDKNKEIDSTKKKITITAKIDSLKAGLSVVLNDLDNGSEIDKGMTIKDGFNLEGVVSENPKEYEILIKDSLTKKRFNIKLWVSKEDILITAKLDNNYVKNIKIEGCKLNTIEIGYKKSTFGKYDTPEINKEIESANPNDKAAIITKYINLIYQEQIKFIYNNPNNLVSLSKILFNKNRISNDSLLLYYNQLDSVLQNSKNGKILKAITSIKKLKVGDTIQDFTAKDINGNLVNLSDFKGKIILLDFWASWCKPCHLQNQQEFSYLNKKYKERGLIIISYSLDKKSAKEEWIEASKSDGINWVNISNLKDFNDPIATQYNIISIPNSFLIDKNGVIVKSFLGYEENSDKIEKEIKKILN